MTPPRPMRSVNVFTDTPEPHTYHGAENNVLVVHESPDRRHITFYGTLPGGVKFHEATADVEETFYIIEGTVTCTPAGGETVVWGPGDLVYWPYDEELELEYSPGLRCICFFWSDEPLPDFVADS